MVVDYLEYSVSTSNQSFGLVSDGNPGRVEVLSQVTPGAANQKTTSSQVVLEAEMVAVGKMELRWVGPPATRYRLEFSSDLKPGSWQMAREGVGDGSLQTFSETIADQPGERFYRLRLE